MDSRVETLEEGMYCHVLKKDTKEIRSTKKSGVRGVPRQMLLIHGFRCGDPSMKEVIMY
jgi:hypothetical protein